jgi:hypothetical protein
MITPALVQANIVDIDNRASALPPTLVADANILYWIFYPNFATLAAAGGRGPAYYQRNKYPAYWVRAARNGCRFYTGSSTIGEYAKTAEYAEIEAIWLTDPSPPHPNPSSPSHSFNASVCKCARYHYSSQVVGIRSDIEITIRSILRTVTLLDLPASASTLNTQACSSWLNSLGDFPDAVLVSTAIAQGVANILSDDSDLATFPGITLYTVNRYVITAARAAGRLL